MSAFTDLDYRWMRHALALAAHAETLGEVPVGAVLVKDNQCVGEGFNQPIATHNPTAHAEIVAIAHAAKAIQNYRLPDTTLYVTLEPCAMCVGAIIHACIARIIYAASDPKSGACGDVNPLSTSQHFNCHPEFCGGCLADEASQLLRRFFQMKRLEVKFA